MGDNSGQRKAQARGRQQQKGAERRGGALELSRVAGLAAAGHPVGDEHDIDDAPMFEADVETGLEAPAGGVWSFGPKGMGN